MMEVMTTLLVIAGFIGDDATHADDSSGGLITLGDNRICR